MKRFILFVAAIALLAACSTKEIDFQTPVQDDVVFYASFEQPSDMDTKVYANEDLLLRWTADDRVSIFNRITYNQQYRFTGETGDNAGGFRKVESDEFVTGNAISHVVSVYPYRETTKITESEVLSVTLPAEQSYAENTFGLGANTMVSVSSDNVLQYKNVGGYLVFKLYGEGVTVSSITLKGNNGEKLAGKASVTMPLEGLPTVEMASDATTEITLVCDNPVQLGATAEESAEFWFVLPPVTFSKGFTISVAETTGGVFEVSTSKSVWIVRNYLSKMAPMAVERIQPNNVICYTSLDGKVISPTRTDGFGANIVSNEYVNGQGRIVFDGDVTGIGVMAFADKTNLASVEMPNSVTSIGLGAFYDCRRLASVLIPDSVTSIGDIAFSSCHSLSSIRIPASVSSLTPKILSSCSSLRTIVVDPGNQTYDSRNDCNAIIETETNTLIIGCMGTTIPYSVTAIGDSVFSGFYDLESMVIPNSVVSIGEKAFYNCFALSSLSIPESLTSFGERAFSGCHSLASIRVHPDNPVFDSRNDCNAIIETSRNALVLGCKNTVIPDSVGGIGWYAFDGCTGLSSIEIPNSVTSIAYAAFYCCTGLTSLVIPESVSLICQNAFSGCKGLASVTVLAVNPPYIDRYYGNADYNVFYGSDCPIYVPAESVEKYKSFPGWDECADRIYAIGTPMAVDLGLSVKWASFNLAASAPEEYGDYYAWGETENKDVFSWSTYKWCMGNYSTMTKYCSDSAYGYNGFTDNKTVLDLEDDAVHTNLGGKWRMPTDAEWTELRENCTWTWTTERGVNGISVTAGNGNSIFLPAAGGWVDSGLYYMGSYGYYWSSSLYNPNYAWYVYFNSDGVNRADYFRSGGFSIRPVYAE